MDKIEMLYTEGDRLRHKAMKIFLIANNNEDLLKEHDSLLEQSQRLYHEAKNLSLGIS
jgi:hypothetical protein